jgi:DNA uptake protein ComE-like DNA-binding protein
MGLTAFNRARRLAQASTAPAPTSTAAPSPERSTSPAESPASLGKSASASPRALLIINEGATPEELAILPTIGKGAGKAILEARPPGGYASLGELPERIFTSPFNCDLAAITAYSDALDE